MDFGSICAQFFRTPRGLSVKFRLNTMGVSTRVSMFRKTVLCPSSTRYKTVTSSLSEAKNFINAPLVPGSRATERTVQWRPFRSALRLGFYNFRKVPCHTGVIRNTYGEATLYEVLLRVPRFLINVIVLYDGLWRARYRTNRVRAVR